MIKPHKIIGDRYLHRWHVIPRNRVFNIYLHKFIGDDDDRALHCHPWASVSFLLKGRLKEVSMGRKVQHDYEVNRMPWLFPVFRRATFAHRLMVVDGPAWTLFITGPVVRDWGFWCPKGWQHWSTMTSPEGKTIGGCE